MEPMALTGWPRDGRGALLAATLGIGVGVASTVAYTRGLGWLQGGELAAYDRLVRWRAGSAPPSERVAIVRIREEEIAEYGHPLPDAVLARALRAIAAQEPRAIGVDLYREAPRPGESRTGWEELSALFRSDPRIVAIEKLPEPGEPGVPPPPFAAGTDRVGFSDVVIDRDGVVRRGLLFLWDENDRPALSLPLRVALLDLGAQGRALAPDPEDPEQVRLGDTTIPPLDGTFGAYQDVDAGGYQYPLDFAAAPEGFPTYDLDDVLDGHLPEGALRDRVVLLGTTSASVKDDFVTARSGGARVHGVALHAYATDQLLRMGLDGDAPLRSWSDRTELLWIFAWGLVGAGIAFAIPNPIALVVATLGCLGALLGIAGWAFAAGLWVPWLPPSIAALASSGGVLAERTRRERAERRVLMDLFGRFNSRRVADELWSRRAEFMRGGRPAPRRLIITAMLTDLKGYTQAAETMDPAALMDWVNEYMNAMTRLIEEGNGGMVDDYTGDGIKANFGVPLAGADPEQEARDARAAVRCALAMGRELERLAEDWRARGLPVALMRVGLFTGEAIVGSLGSAERMKYTTVGDTVNTAARLESFHKEDAVSPARDGRAPLFRILIGDTTRRHLGDEEFELEDLGVHTLRGRAEPVRIFRVWGFVEEKEEV